MIRDLGFAVEPGVHGLVAAKYIHVSWIHIVVFQFPISDLFNLCWIIKKLCHKIEY